MLARSTFLSERRRECCRLRGWRRWPGTGCSCKVYRVQEYRVSHDRSPLFELLRAEKPGAWSRVAALTGDIEEDMLGLGPGELVTTYLGVSRQEEKRPIHMLDIQ